MWRGRRTMDGITATLDTRPLVAKLDQLERRLVLRSLNRSLDRATKTMGKVAAQAIRERLNLKVRDIKKSVVPYRRAKARGVAEIRVLPKPVPIMAYAARQTRRGVTFKVKRHGGRQRLPHAFVATMPSGHKGVFTRAGKGAPRFPIRERFSTSVRQYMDDKRLQRRVIRAGQATFVKNLRSEIRYIATDRAQRASALQTVLERSDFL